jgi:DNA-binding IclR family transcriptional regulator
VNAIARELSIAPSSCFKILKSLHNEGFVECEERSKGYSLGLGVASLSRRALDPTNAFSVLRPNLERIAQEEAIAIGLWRIVPNRRIVLAGFCEGATPMRIHMTLGQRLPRLIGAVGRAIAADLRLSTEEIRTELAAMTWQNPPSVEEYLAEVERARRLGYALDIGNFAQGVCSIATTVRDEAGEIHFGITGIMFNGQHDDEAIRRIGGALVDFSKAAALRLGLSRT